MFSFDYVKDFDPEVAKAMEDELGRQRNNLELIASENLVSEAVMAAMGSHLTNKYAEGYPGKRYYGQSEHRFPGHLIFCPRHYCSQHHFFNR